MEAGKRHARWKKKGTEQFTVASHIHPSIAFSSPSFPLFTPFLHLSNFNALWRENMSVTRGIILGGQCFSLKHTQQIHAIAYTRPRLNDSWSGVPASALFFSSALPPLISALIWFDPLAFFSLCCSCYCQAWWHSLSLKQLNCRLGGLTWEGWQLPA